MRPRMMTMLVAAALLTCAGVRAADDEAPAPTPSPPPAAQAPPATSTPPATSAPPAASAAPKEQAKEPSKESSKEPSPPPSVTVIGARDAHGILGRDVRSSANENMGRIVAVIDFGGFLGVGSRKIVVDWNALRFAGVSSKSDSITLDLNKQQVSAAPEYKEDTPLIVLGAAGSLHPWDYEH